MKNPIRQTTMKPAARVLFSLTITAAAYLLCPAQQPTQSNSLSPGDVAQVITAIKAPSANETMLSQAIAVGGDLLREKRYPEASELFSALAAKMPENIEVVYAEALAVFNAGRAREAEPIAERAVNLSRTALIANNAEAVQRAADSLVLLGVVLAVNGHDDRSVKALQEAARIAPRHFDAQLSLGRQLFGMGDDSAAIRAFQTAKTLQPNNAQVLFFLATALERAGEIQPALATYRELTVLRPDSYEGHLGLGALLLKRSELDEGRRELERALEINPNLYEAQVALGRALIIGGRPSDSIAHLQKAAELAPNNPEPHYQLSLAYRRLGRRQEAAEEAAIVKRIHESRRGTKGASLPAS
jgi:tetratricopeptide (TPR) repeat protein